MIKLVWNRSFERKLHDYIKKHPEKKMVFEEKLKIFTENPHSPQLKNHKLSGKLKELRAIAIEYDCRLVFKMIDEHTALLVSIGSHEEVY